MDQLRRGYCFVFPTPENQVIKNFRKNDQAIKAVWYEVVSGTRPSKIAESVRAIGSGRSVPLTRGEQIMVNYYAMLHCSKMSLLCSINAPIML